MGAQASAVCKCAPCARVVASWCSMESRRAAATCSLIETVLCSAALGCYILTSLHFVFDGTIFLTVPFAAECGVERRCACGRLLLDQDGPRCTVAQGEQLTSNDAWRAAFDFDRIFDRVVSCVTHTFRSLSFANSCIGLSRTSLLLPPPPLPPQPCKATSSRPMLEQDRRMRQAFTGTDAMRYGLLLCFCVCCTHV